LHLQCELCEPRETKIKIFWCQEFEVSSWKKKHNSKWPT
jgi:hypothetical protein